MIELLNKAIPTSNINIPDKAIPDKAIIVKIFLIFYYLI